MNLFSFLRCTIFVLFGADIGLSGAKPVCSDKRDLPELSFVLDPKVLASGFADDGQNPPAAGQSASLTSTNNFINFCRDIPLPITDGQQLKTGSCNPAPMGVIPANTAMPYVRLEGPAAEQQTPIEERTPIPVAVRVKNLDAGWFVNPHRNYASAPQQLGDSGFIRGHLHVVIEHASSGDVKDFVWFRALNGNTDADGRLRTVLEEGLPPGQYRLSTITTAANHQPVLLPVAQRGAVDDTVYFTVVPRQSSGADTGSPDAASAASNNNGTASTTGSS